MNDNKLTIDDNQKKLFNDAVKYYTKYQFRIHFQDEIINV